MYSLFNDIYRDKTVLVTGHTGFKGSWLTLWLQNLGARVIGFSSKDNNNNLHFRLTKTEVTNVWGDIRSFKEINSCVRIHKPQIVFHLAAQSLVGESYRSPVYTYETNVIGTLNLLEACRSCRDTEALVNVTSDKVYENKETGIPFSETAPLGGNDIYSSSKACSELLTNSYRASFLPDSQLKIASARAGNVIGGGDWAKDRLIPDVIRAIEANTTVKIRNPLAVRPWQHVLDPLSGYLLLGQKLCQKARDFDQSWNFGPSGDSHINVEELLGRIKRVWSSFSYELLPSPAFKEAAVLNLDCSKAEKEMDWKSIWKIDKALEYTLEWYMNYLSNGISGSNADLEAYILDAERSGVSWIRTNGK